MAGRPGVAVEVFAVTDTTCQVVCRRLPAGPHRLRVGADEVTVVGDDGPCSAWFEGLRPATDVTVVLDGRTVAHGRTLPALDGPVRSRVATISDLHIGQDSLGRLPRLPDPPNLHCVRAALEEIVRWGADVLVVKGDVTEEGLASDWEAFADLLDGYPIPVTLTFGNHDVRSPRRADPRPMLAAAGVTVTPPHGVTSCDLPGLRLVVADTTTAHNERGQLDRIRGEVVDAAHGAGTTPVLVALHHQLQRFPIPHHWPPGVPSGQAGRLLDDLGREHPAIVSSGHTHRHRARRHGQLVTTEVGSVKDFPGVWAAYEAHDGGLRQTVRRVGGPEVLRWTDLTASTALGVWGRWSPGRIDDRCLQTGT